MVSHVSLVAVIQCTAMGFTKWKRSPNQRHMGHFGLDLDQDKDFVLNHYYSL